MISGQDNKTEKHSDTSDVERSQLFDVDADFVDLSKSLVVDSSSFKSRETLDTFQVIEREPPPPLPADFPKLYKYISEFEYLDKEREDEERKNSLFNASFHALNTANYKGKKFWIKHYPAVKSPRLGEPYDRAYFKPGLELCCWLWDRITARNIVANQIYLILDNENRIVGLAIEDIPGFKTNRSEPLKADDLNIEALKKTLNSKRDNLIEALNKVTPYLKRYDYDPQHSTYATMALSNIKFWCQRGYATIIPSYANSKSVPTNDFIQSFLIEGADFSRERVGELVSRLSARQKYVSTDRLKTVAKDSLDYKRYREEVDRLEDALKIAGKMISVNPEDHVDIEELDEINRITRKKNTDLDSTDKISVTLASGKVFEIKTRDVKNIRIAEGNAIIDVENWTGFENDDHNKNRSKKGEKIDHDMKQWWFTCDFKEANYEEEIKRTYSSTYFDSMKDMANSLLAWLGWNTRSPKDAFEYTEYDVENFPEIRDTLPFLRYWRVKENASSRSQSIPQTLRQMIASVFDLEKLVAIFKENFYTTHDVTVSKNLKSNQMYNFYKYKQLLKKILVIESIYQQSFELSLPKDSEYLSKDGKKKKIADFVPGIVERMEKLKKSLVNIPGFQEFLAQHGPYALRTIKEDVDEDKADCLRQAEREPCFTHLAELYTTKTMDIDYQNIVIAAQEAEKLRMEGTSNEGGVRLIPQRF